MAPLVFKYKYVKFKAERIDHASPEELERRLNVYREDTAPKLVDLILSMGGIYIKIGQVMSTIGQGILPQQYVEALKPLQDGVPARDYEDIAQIIRDSTGKSMDELFVHFDKKPIGSASVAQVHRATLRPRKEGDEPIPIVLKVQYPEVAELFDADLSNLEMATRLFAPENMEVAKSLRKRHENELGKSSLILSSETHNLTAQLKLKSIMKMPLDFTKEADNLRECTRDMQKFGMEPNLVRIPRVVDQICTPNVLAMEYLEGVSLSDAIQQEQDKVAKALGKKDGDELKAILASRMREHFENGGGAGEGGLQSMLGGKNKMKLVNAFGPTATSLLRTYASVRDGVENAALNVAKFGSKLRRELIHGDRDELDLIANGKNAKKSVNLGRALKTLVHVHGIQVSFSNLNNKLLGMTNPIDLDTVILIVLYITDVAIWNVQCVSSCLICACCSMACRYKFLIYNSIDFSIPPVSDPHPGE